MKERQSTVTTKERILREAEHLIHLRGFKSTSLDEIARRCKMTKANLLHHYRSKEDLGLAVLDFKMDCYRRSCLAPLFSGNPDPAEAVTKLFDMASCFHRSNGCRAGCFIANIALEMSDSSERFRERAGQFFQEWADRIEETLRLGDGQATPESTALAEAILSMYEGAVMLARTKRDPSVFDRVGKVALELLSDYRRRIAPRAQEISHRR
ncbi:MAG: TetR/AcrR family transcriptional regulator [Elusimicrobia bacterium]|nr:TetR/AcrR family transcriptional regulator [Elusimicrobiota bacterium]